MSSNRSQTQQTTKPEIASTGKPSNAGRDARPTTSKGVVGGGPLLDEQKDNRIAELEKQLELYKDALEDSETVAKINMKQKIALRDDLKKKESDIRKLKDALKDETHKLKTTEDKARLKAHTDSEAIEVRHDQRSSNKDYEKILLEKDKLLDDREKLLEGKDEQIHKLMEDAKAERDDNKARRADLEKQLADHKRMLQDCENAVKINMEEKLKLFTDLGDREFHIQNLTEALNTETDKLRNAEEKAKIVAHNNKERIEELTKKRKELRSSNKELDEKDLQIHKLMEDAKTEMEQNKARRADLEKQLADHNNLLQDWENAAKINTEAKLKLCSDLDSKEYYIQQLTEVLNTETDKLRNAEEKAKIVAHHNRETIQDLTKERNELRSRLCKHGKAASDMLTAGGNPDIADLSDPNRALKLSERFSSLYDDPWTDAFEALTQHHHQDPKAVIQQLFSILKTCFEFCKETEQSQMDSLRNLFLHPCQAASRDVKAGKHKVTIGTSDDKALKDLRRRIATNSSYVVKAQCMSHLNKQLSAKDDVTMSAGRAYSESCIELCWLMVLHDPPLHLELDVKPGTKMGSHYSNYGGSGDTIDYVVWPPLYNGPGGGMLTKGTAAPLASKKKAPKK